MFAPSNTVRFAAAALAAFVGATLLLAKAHFSDEYGRMTVRHETIVLPVVEVVAARPAHLVAAPVAQRAN